jgi:hypothetical protein
MSRRAIGVAVSSHRKRTATLFERLEKMEAGSGDEEGELEIEKKRKD